MQLFIRWISAADRYDLIVYRRLRLSLRQDRRWVNDQYLLRQSIWSRFAQLDGQLTMPAHVLLVYRDFGELWSSFQKAQIFESGYISHTSFRRVTKFGTNIYTGLTN